MQPRFDIFFNLFKACHDGIAFYPTGNPMVTQQIENFIKICHQFMEGDYLVISLDPRGIVMNGHPIPPKLRSSPSAHWLHTSLNGRHIHNLVLHRGLAIRDMELLMQLLNLEPARLEQPDAGGQILASQNVWRIQVNTTRKRGSEHPFHGLQEPTLPELPSMEDSMRGMDASVVAIPSSSLSAPQNLPDPPLQTELLIEQEEQEKLYEAMKESIEANNLNRVAETLTLIRADLAAEDREDRELAFSSYHVVVSCLVDTRQESSLLIVLKSMGKDLLQTQERDLYAIHLASTLRIIDFFQQVENLKGVAYGLNVLANQNLRKDFEVRILVSNALQHLMDLQLVGRLINSTDQELLPVRKALFHRHGLGILKPLLAALFSSEDRNLRKRLMEIITNLGSLSYEHLLEELKASMKEHRPWYIKRNLLSLLSISPPVELMAWLPELYKEQNPKMRDLVVRCLFQIHTPDAFKMGRLLLHESNGSRLMKILSYVQMSRHSLYANEVMAVFTRVDDDSTRMEAILALEKIKSEESLGYLADILDKDITIDGKLKVAHRIAAARSLARFQNKKALNALSRHKRDFNKEVREVVNQALERDKE